MKYGLKLWSTNVDVIAEANDFLAQGLFDFIELYVVPQTKYLLPQWKSFDGPFMIHCAHSAHEFNLAQEAKEDINKTIFQETQLFANELKAQVIVVHGGNTGTLKEAIRQFKGMNDKRVYVENKPKKGLNDGLCIGWSPEEVKDIIEQANLSGMVLDFGHAIYAANANNSDTFEMIKGFLRLSPTIFHIGDGDISLDRDCHKNFGEGDFDLQALVDLIPELSDVTIETPGGAANELSYYRKDVLYLKNLIEGK